MSSTRGDLSSAIDRYECEVILPCVLEIRNSFFIHVVYNISLAFFWILANVERTSVTFIGSLGLSLLGFGVNFKATLEAYNKFTSERRFLKETVSSLKGLMDLCGDDEECLKEIEMHLKSIYQKKL